MAPRKRGGLATTDDPVGGGNEGKAAAAPAGKEVNVQFEQMLDVLMLVGYGVMLVWTLLAFGSSIAQDLAEARGAETEGWQLDLDMLRILSPFKTAEELNAIHYDRCDIDAIHYNGNHKLSTARLAMPHLVKGVSSLWAGHDLGWDAFRSAHGALPVLPRDVSSAVRAQFGHATLRDVLPVDPADPTDAGHAGEITLAEFADRVRNKSLGHKMWFDVAGTTAATTFMAAAGIDRLPGFLPSDLGPAAKWRPAVSFGGAGSGLPFHTHGPAWLATVQGAKLWFLLPSTHWPPATRGLTLAPMGLATAKAMLKAPPAGLKVCLARRGDALWVPDGWAHATLDLGETLGVGAQQIRAVDPAVKDENVGKVIPQPREVKTALEAAIFGNWAFNAGNDDVALAMLTRATELEPLNFKAASNLVAALLGTQRYPQAVSSATQASTMAIELTAPEEAAYVVAGLGLLFFEAATTITGGLRGAMGCAHSVGDRGPHCQPVDNLLDFAIRTLLKARELAPLPSHVQRVAVAAGLYFEAGADSPSG